MKKLAIDDVDDVPHFMGINSTRKPLSRHIEEMEFAMVHFELDPDESFSGGLHTHHDQEELFYVMEGTATFEVKEQAGDDAERYEVGPNEVIHFEKGGPYQTGGNRSDERVVGIALGVPNPRHGWKETEVLFDCPSCGTETVHDIATENPGDERMPDLSEMRISCRDCGNVVET